MNMAQLIKDLMGEKTADTSQESVPLEKEASTTDIEELASQLYKLAEDLSSKEAEDEKESVSDQKVAETKPESPKQDVTVQKDLLKEAMIEKLLADKELSEKIAKKLSCGTKMPMKKKAGEVADQEEKKDE